MDTGPGLFCFLLCHFLYPVGAPEQEPAQGIAADGPPRPLDAGDCSSESQALHPK